MKRESGLLSVGLLGPLAPRLGRKPVRTSAPKQRQVLALLALNAGRVVTVPTLVDELWGDHPPRSYATTLQTYILQLRNALAAVDRGDLGARQLLSTGRHGYQLEADTCETDVEVFHRRVRAGRAAAEAGDHGRASAELDRALGLWRGSALVDVRLGRVLEIEASSLEEHRLRALESRIEADLRLGRHADLLGELTFVAAKHPMNETLCAYLMTALYRAGHVGRSLQAFHRLRAALNRELGIEPCQRLQRLQAAIVSGTGR
ncbi:MULTISPECIES: AfsR/SARP family transcriptional regulator [unclassified Streptomyces]|jgi:DNA-binding SARP family transcriptional activator|uniref:AfsR/SARP family transcriptional regulator n=1 Tax=Streptomyces TaxID=1883 RepID=UPI0019045041|nr:MULTISPECIES: AfsR/SARP family transcriptional regulator [unclassified Streptomyces]MCU4746994.1 AfsR/SARP family transcriptional regulator [Streptomyces sp. G-5]QQN77677.1 AfsR/SARP family transcriptional regulator [Streptomyces sp. XC 2026]